MISFKKIYIFIILVDLYASFFWYPDPDQRFLIRIRTRVLANDTDPTGSGSGSGSETLVKIKNFSLFCCNFVYLKSIGGNICMLFTNWEKNIHYLPYFLSPFNHFRGLQTRNLHYCNFSTFFIINPLVYE